MDTVLVAVKVRHIGVVLPCSIGGCDVGEAELADGRIVAITWGRNLTLRNAQEAYCGAFTPVDIGDAWEGGTRRPNYEWLIEPAAIKHLRMAPVVGAWVEVFRSRGGSEPY